MVAAVRERHPDGIDAVVGPSTMRPAAASHRPSPPPATARAHKLHLRPIPRSPRSIARHLAGGALKVPIQDTYDLAQAPQALGSTHTQGKLAIRVA